MLSDEDIDMIRNTLASAVRQADVSTATTEIIECVFGVMVDHYKWLRAWNNDMTGHADVLRNALHEACHDMANLVGPCTGEKPTPEHDWAITMNSDEAAQASSSWWDAWLRRAALDEDTEEGAPC